MLTIYPPVGAGDLNEQGLTFLCSAGDFDALITGDMAGNTEKKLVERFDLPDIEVLVVGAQYDSEQLHNQFRLQGRHVLSVDPDYTEVPS